MEPTTMETETGTCFGGYRLGEREDAYENGGSYA
jgi:hypothetical protein